MAASPDRAGGHLCDMGVTWLTSFIDCPDRWPGLKVTVQENIIDTAENPLLSIIDARTKPLRYVNLNRSQSWKSCSETMFTLFKTSLAILYVSFKAQIRDHFFKDSSMINQPTPQTGLGNLQAFKLAPCAYLEKTLSILYCYVSLM